MAVSGRESPSEQHYSLKWNDYSVKLVTAFQSLRDEEDFVDVTVACDGHQYSAHKMVLSACSPYFRAMLRANPCQHPIVILKDVGHNEMERLLEFMYNGEVNIAQDQLAAFLRTAENLKIRGLAGSSDDMEQIYNRDYGNISTSEKLYNQQQQLQQHNSTSVSAIATTNNSSGSQHNHQGIMSNNGFTKEEGDGGLSVTTADCYSPAPKKRKLVMLDNTEQDGIAEGDTALDGSGDANSVAALVTRAGPLGVEVKCLSRDLKAEPCETGSEAGLTGGGEAVYNSGGDDQTSHEQLMPSHLYSIGVSSSTGAAGGASHQDLGSAAQHNDQGGVREVAARGSNNARQHAAAAVTDATAAAAVTDATADKSSTSGKISSTAGARSRDCNIATTTTTVAFTAGMSLSATVVAGSKGCNNTSTAAGGAYSVCVAEKIKSSLKDRRVESRKYESFPPCDTSTSQRRSEDGTNGQPRSCYDYDTLGLSGLLDPDVTIKKEEVEYPIAYNEDTSNGGSVDNTFLKAGCLQNDERVSLQEHQPGNDANDTLWTSLVQQQFDMSALVGTNTDSSSKSIGNKPMKIGLTRRPSQPHSSGTNLNIPDSRTTGSNTHSNALTSPFNNFPHLPSTPPSIPSEMHQSASYGVLKHSRFGLHAAPKMYQCQLCPKSFHTRTTLSRHSRIHSGTALVCPECGKLFYQKSNLNYHVSAIHGYALGSSQAAAEPRNAVPTAGNSVQPTDEARGGHQSLAVEYTPTNS